MTGYCGYGLTFLICYHHELMLHILSFFAGFEYWANPSNLLECYIMWIVDMQKSIWLSVMAAAVGPHQGANGTHVGQRLILEELMSIVLNLCISHKCFLFLLCC
jgi:hypothetical protein